MMYSNFGLGGQFVWLQIHCVFVALLALTFLATLVWMIRFANKKMLVNFIWITLLFGILGMFLTAPFSFSAMEDMHDLMYDEF